MSKSYEQTPEDLLQNSVGSGDMFLGFIQQKVTELKKLNELWGKAISTGLAEHSRVANFRSGCLVIEVDNAAWVTYLRYHLPELKNHLSTQIEFAALQKIEWYIRPPMTNPSTQKVKKSALILSENSIELLKNTAQQINNKRLQEALLRLIQP